MIRVTRRDNVLHIETDIGGISIHDNVLRSGNASFETRILCYLADYLEKPRTAAPVPMLLFCPKCSTQHIDAPDERTEGWDNPPHRSHLCHACGCIWRPADVPTTGVRSIKTAGKADTWNASTPAAPGIDVANEVESLRWQLERANNAIATLHSSQQLRDKVAGVLDASPNGGSMSDCPIIRLAPGEYTDWEKRVWRRGVIECATQSDIAAAMQATSPKGGHCTTCTCDPNMTPAIRFDLSPAMVEGEVKNHLIALGWTPPDSPKGDDTRRLDRLEDKYIEVADEFGVARQLYFGTFAGTLRDAIDAAMRATSHSAGEN